MVSAGQKGRAKMAMTSAQAQALWEELASTAPTWEKAQEKLALGLAPRAGQRLQMVDRTCTDASAVCAKCIPHKIIVPKGTVGNAESIVCPQCRGSLVWMVPPRIERVAIPHPIGGYLDRGGTERLDWAIDCLRFLGECPYPGCRFHCVEMIVRARLVERMSLREISAYVLAKTGEACSRATIGRLSQRWWPVLWLYGPKEAASRWHWLSSPLSNYKLDGI